MLVLDETGIQTAASYIEWQYTPSDSSPPAGIVLPSIRWDALESGICCLLDILHFKIFRWAVLLPSAVMPPSSPVLDRHQTYF